MAEISCGVYSLSPALTFDVVIFAVAGDARKEPSFLPTATSLCRRPMNRLIE